MIVQAIKYKKGKVTALLYSRSRVYIIIVIELGQYIKFEPMINYSIQKTIQSL